MPKRDEKRGKLINSIKDSLAQGNKIANSPQLVALAEKAGMKAGEDYQSIKELYDIAGLALNRYIMDSGDRFSPLNKTPEQAKQIVEDLIDLQDLLPTETQRSATQVDLQQYSTPPALAFLVNWTAGITQTDTVLEPSAGEGNIAVFASLVGYQGCC